MVDPRMAQATAVHTKIAMIAAIRLIMVFCVSNLSAAPATYLSRLALSSTFHNKVKTSFIQTPGFGPGRASASSSPYQMRPESDAAIVMDLRPSGRLPYPHNNYSPPDLK